MSLARRCSNSFDPFVRTRGRLCYFQKLVDVGADACGVTALVEGSGAKPYEVNLEWDSAVTGTLSANCTCPYFQKGALCKHIWATILAVDSEGLSREIPGNRALQVVLARHPNAANPVAVAATGRPAHRAGGVRPHRSIAHLRQRQHRLRPRQPDLGADLCPSRPYTQMIGGRQRLWIAWDEDVDA